MEMQPLVSIILVTRNHPQELSNALRSLARQTYEAFEILVVNNGGEDLRHLVDSIDTVHYTQYIHLEEQLYSSAAKNIALGRAKGEFITYLDDQDSPYPRHIEQLATFLQDNPNIGAAYSDAHLGHPFVFASGLTTVRKEELPARNFDSTQLLINNYIPVSCMMHRASCLAHTGMFDETLVALEDWDLWIRISKLYPIRRIPVTSARISSMGKNHIPLSVTPAQTIDMLLTVYRKHEIASSENMLLSQMRMHHIIGLYRDLAEKYEQDHIFDEAERLWQRIAELSGRPEDLFRLGLIRHKMGKTDQARLTLNLAKELHHPRTANGE